MYNQTKGINSKNPPQIIQDLIQQVNQTRLYLLKRLRPTSLKYCDENGNQFKVELSTNLICSCNQNKSHCIHTIHALLKVFQVDEKCPIIWQQSYSQYDIANILSGQYKTTKLEQNKKRQQINIIRKQQQQFYQKNTIVEDQQQITKDDICPICQESLLCNEAYLYCQKQCKNNFHAKCLKVWVLQKQSVGKKINCPMCRVHWDENILVEINQIEKEFINLNKIQNKICSNCKITPIIGTLYTCISCPNYHLCDKCHNKKIHQLQHIFMFKYLRFEKYQFELNFTIESLIKLIPENLNFANQEAGGFILVGTGFQKKGKCSFCQKQKQLRLLECGHIADENCINRMKDHFYICPIDNQPQFIGLFNNLTQEEKDLHLTETKKWIVQKQDQNNNQNNKLPLIGKSPQTRPKQISQQQTKQQQQYSIERRLSEHRKIKDNPQSIKFRSKLENLI